MLKVANKKLKLERLVIEKGGFRVRSRTLMSNFISNTSAFWRRKIWRRFLLWKQWQTDWSDRMKSLSHVRNLPSYSTEIQLWRCSKSIYPRQRNSDPPQPQPQLLPHKNRLQHRLQKRPRKLWQLQRQLQREHRNLHRRRIQRKHLLRRQRKNKPQQRLRTRHPKQVSQRKEGETTRWSPRRTPTRTDLSS